MKCVKTQWINYSYSIMAKILKENNINFDYIHKQIQVTGEYNLSDELKLYIFKMIEFLEMMSENENAKALKEFLTENRANGRVIGLAKPMHSSQIGQPPAQLPPKPTQPTLPPLPINKLLPRSPPHPPSPPPPHYLQYNPPQHNPPLKPLPQPPITLPSSYEVGPPQPRGFNPPPPPPPHSNYSDVVKFYKGEIKLDGYDIQTIITSPLELLVDFDFIYKINVYILIIIYLLVLYSSKNSAISSF